MLTIPSNDRAVQLESYRRAVFREGQPEQIGAAFIGDEIGAGVFLEGANEVAAPDTLPIIAIMAMSTRRRQNYDLLGPRTTSPLVSDTVAIIPCGQTTWWAAREPMRNLHVHIEPAYLERLSIPLLDVDRPRYGVSDPVVTRIGRLIAAALVAREDSHVLIEHLLIAFSARLFFRKDCGPAVAKGGLSAFALRRCVEHLHARMADKVTISELAAIADLSPFHFVRMFRHSTGHPPFRYHQRLRVEHAKMLLFSTTMSVSEIATAVGYHNAGAFARVFRAHTGRTPTAWRTNA